MKDGESLAVWTLKGTSLSDNKTRVVCQKEDSTDAPSAVLLVYGKYSVNTLLMLNIKLLPHNMHKYVSCKVNFDIVQYKPDKHF